jgi:hypothetical protein
MAKRIRLFLGIAILAFSIALLMWGYVPNRHEIRSRLVAPDEMRLPTQASTLAAIPETRRLTLDFPPKMRTGVEADTIRLTLEVDALGNVTPVARVEGSTVVGETLALPDLYATHNVTAEARLSLVGMQVQPSGAIYEPLQKGQSATFHWTISPQKTGVYRGTVWLHLNFVDKSTGEESRIAVSAQIIEVQAVDFFGYPVRAARTAGWIGSVVGAVVGFPVFKGGLRALFRRRKQMGISRPNLEE